MDFARKPWGGCVGGVCVDFAPKSRVTPILHNNLGGGGGGQYFCQKSVSLKYSVDFA